MSKTDHVWASPPPLKPDVYMTRRNQSSYLTLRYWDGSDWHEVAYSGSRGGAPFVWPTKSQMKRPSWAVTRKANLHLRRINANVCAIQWGKPFKVYDQKEVLKWLVKENILRADWLTHYQGAMPQGDKK